MDLIKVGEKLMSSIRSFKLLSPTSDRPEVPARAAAVAAVARALAGVPPHQRLALSATSSGLASLYDSGPRGQTVEQLEEEFYEEDFDPVRHVLENIPIDENDLSHIEKMVSQRLVQLDVVTEQLSHKVMEHYEELGAVVTEPHINAQLFDIRELRKMAEQEEAGQIVNNARDNLKRRLANISNRVSDLDSEIMIQKSAYEVDPDNQAENFADHLKRCRRVLHSLHEEYYECKGDFVHCLCDIIPNPECRFIGYCLQLEMVRTELTDVKELIWESWLDDMKERGEKHSMLREAVRVVESLPVFKITKKHLKKKVKCGMCPSHHFEIGEEVCHLPCNKGHIFHRDCIEDAWYHIADMNDQACYLRSEIIREKTAYEQNRHNQAAYFASHLNMFQEVLESLEEHFYVYAVHVDNCKCENRIPECNRYRATLERVKLNFVELKNLMQEGWSSYVLQLVEGLPAVKNFSENHNKDGECAICFSVPEIVEERALCHLPCNEGHIFHRNCISKWLKVKNQCPICRKPA